MDSLAQSLIWLAWESSPDAAAPPPWSPQQRPAAGSSNQAIALALRDWSVAIAAGSVILASTVAPPAWANSHRYGDTVYVDVPQGYALNVRWGPSTSNGIYRRVRRGSPLQVSGVRRNGWVQLVDATWVAGNLVCSDPAACGGVVIDPLPEDRRNLATVITPQNLALNIRSGPGVNYRIVGQFLNGTQIPLTGRFSVGWAELTNNTWVDSRHLEYFGPRVEVIPPDPNPVPLPAEVMEVQRRLQQLGYLPASFAITGINDQTTQNAVREFQRSNGLPVTGTVDDVTRQALFIATIPNNEVRVVQRQLQQLGYLPANFAITGIKDQTTQNAVRTFQRINGLPITGTVDAATRNKLDQLTAPPLTPSPTPDPTTPPPSGARQVRVVTDGESTSVFDGPGTDFTVLRSVPNGSIVNVTGRTSGNWSELADGGWIFSFWLDEL